MLADSDENVNTATLFALFRQFTISAECNKAIIFAAKLLDDQLIDVDYGKRHLNGFIPNRGESPGWVLYDLLTYDTAYDPFSYASQLLIYVQVFEEQQFCWS